MKRICCTTGCNIYPFSVCVIQLPTRSERSIPVLSDNKSIVTLFSHKKKYNFGHKANACRFCRTSSILFLKGSISPSSFSNFLHTVADPLFCAFLVTIHLAQSRKVAVKKRGHCVLIHSIRSRTVRDKGTGVSRVASISPVSTPASIYITVIPVFSFPSRNID